MRAKLSALIYDDLSTPYLLAESTGHGEMAPTYTADANYTFSCSTEALPSLCFATIAIALIVAEGEVIHNVDLASWLKYVTTAVWLYCVVVRMPGIL